MYNVRLVVELKRGFNVAEIEAKLYELTPLESSINLNMNGITEDNKLANYNPLEVIQTFITFRKKVIRTRSTVKLAALKKQEHILEGIQLILTGGTMDKVLDIIRSCESEDVAKSELIAKVGLSLRQSEAVVAMRLGRLTSYGLTDIKASIKKIHESVVSLIALVTDEVAVNEMIEGELDEACKHSGCPKVRRTELVNIDKSISNIPQGTSVISLTENGMILRVPEDQFRVQRRGGKGKTITKMSKGDSLLSFFQSDNQVTLMAFTNTGRVFKFIAGSLPEGRLTTMGINIKNVLSLLEGETIVSLFPTSDVLDSDYLVLVTYEGKVKKTLMSDYLSNRETGLIAISLNEGDEIAAATICSEADDVVIMSARGMCARYNSTEITPTGRTTQGVMGLRFKEGEDDIIIGVAAVDPTQEGDYSILTLADNGLGKLTALSEHGTTKRPAMGYQGISLREDATLVNFEVIHSADDVDVMAMSESGAMIRVDISGIAKSKRRTFGTKIMNVSDDDSVLNFVLIENTSGE